MVDATANRTYIHEHMKIEFADKRLALIRTDRAHELGLPFGVVKSCRDKLDFMESAPDERSIRNWKSLNYKKIGDGEAAPRQVRINDQYRIVFHLETETNPPTLTVLEIGDPH